MGVRELRLSCYYANICMQSSSVKCVFHCGYSDGFGGLGREVLNYVLVTKPRRNFTKRQNLMGRSSSSFVSITLFLLLYRQW